MQEAAFKKIGSKAFYLTLELAPKDFSKFVKKISKSSIKGFNVTVPYKEKIIKGLHRVSSEAKLIGAVNTVFLKKGKLCGANTDAAGFANSLLKDAGFNPRGKNALVIGAGGSSRAVLYALGSLGVKKVFVANRTLSRAHVLTRKFSKVFARTNFEVCSLNVKELKSVLKEVQLVVNTTSVGLKRTDRYFFKASDIPKATAKCKILFFDLIYKPSMTVFLKQAKKRGHRILHGAGMLARQGAKSFELWTGKRAPAELMKKVLEAKLK